VVDQLDVLFRITHHTKTQRVTKNRGRHCGDIHLVTYLVNVTGPVPLVLDLRIVHDRFGNRSDPSLNGHWHYPNDIDKSLNETVTDKIWKYRVDYNNNPPSVVSFMSSITGTSGSLHSEFIRLLFLQKLTFFLLFQEFNFRNMTVDYSTSAVWRCRSPWKVKSVAPPPRLYLNV
jgi:hypothetical protein